MADTIDWDRLAKTLRVRRAEDDIDQKAAAKQIPISASALCRLERGKTCTADNYLLVCSWLGADPTEFSGLR